MKNLTFANEKIEQLANTLKEVINDGGRFQGAEIIANTSVSLQPKKDGCPYGAKDDVRSTTEYSVNVNGIYQNAINKRREKEEKQTDFVAKQNWHVKIFDGANGSIVAKRSEVENGLPITEVYILFVCKDKPMPSYNYTIQGKPATEEEIATIKFYKANRKAQASTYQGLSEENAVVVNTVAASNIIELRANKQVVRF
jgi:hypothetical protein